MQTDTLAAVVAELAARPGHEKVRALLHRLLTDGLGAPSTDIDFEQRLPEVQGRIDAVLGRTVFEVKSNLRREREDAETQLARYLPEREAATGRRFVGVATDGAEWQPYEMREDRLVPLGPRFEPNRDKPRTTLAWLESVVTLHESIAPEVETIRNELGRESLAYGRALSELGRLWETARTHPEAHPEAALKRDVWDRLLSVSYGAEVGSDPLFLQHTYLTVMAKTIATLALLASCRRKRRT